MTDERPELKLGKGQSFFVKSRLKRLPQHDEVWEADFHALPKPVTQTETAYLGLVVTLPHGFLLAETEVTGKPGVNDLAKLLAEAMRRPLVEGAHRPTRIHLRGHHQWRELFPHLKELKIEVSVERELPTLNEAFAEFLRPVQEHRRKKRRSTASHDAVERLFPAIALWVKDAHIEIGDQQGVGFVVRALDYGGLVFEDATPKSLAEALVALENGLRKWFEEEGIEVDHR